MPHVANSATTKKRERDSHLLAAASKNEPPPPVRAPASLLAAASGAELVELAHAQASWICAREEDTTARGTTAPPTFASMPEFPGSPLSATARAGVRLVDLMSLAELQDEQAEAALSNLLPLSHH